MRPQPTRSQWLIATTLALTATLASCGTTNKTSSSDDPSGTKTSTAETNSAEPNKELSTLKIHHPPTLAFAAPFAVMAKTEPKIPGVEQTTYETWKSPDVLRSLLANGKTSIAATPSYAGANLYNKGAKVRLAGVTVWGLLHLIGPEGAPADWSALKGKTVAVPFKGDMPDLVFQFLLKKNGLDPQKDLNIAYFAQGSEVAGQLVTGKADYVVLPEHVATVAINKATKAGRKVKPVFDLQTEWAKATGQKSARIPQAGVVVYGDLPEKHPQAIGAALKGLDDAIKEVNKADQKTVATIATATKVPAPIVTKVIDRLNLEYIPAKTAKPELERFYKELSTLNPDIIGGKLPDDKFYLDDLRK